MSKSTSSQKLQTKDQVPDPIQFKGKEQIHFFSKAADQKPRTRSNSVLKQGTNQLLLKSCRPKTKDQIQFSLNAKNKLTSSQKLQTKNQGPHQIQFKCKEQIDFLSKAADQRPRTRSNSVNMQKKSTYFQKLQTKDQDQIQCSSNAKNKLASSQKLQTKDQGADLIQFKCKE
jgi:hypothetical protein